MLTLWPNLALAFTDDTRVNQSHVRRMNNGCLILLHDFSPFLNFIREYTFWSIRGLIHWKGHSLISAFPAKGVRNKRWKIFLTECLTDVRCTKCLSQRNVVSIFVGDVYCSGCLLNVEQFLSLLIASGFQILCTVSWDRTLHLLIMSLVGYLTW